MWGRWLLGGVFLASGTMHFLYPAPFLAIVPPYLPWHVALVQISGTAELAGGLGLFLPRFRRAAGYGLALLLLAVWPANIYMATAHLPMPGLAGQSWLQWLRVPLQIPLIAWALWCARAQERKDPDPGG